MAAEIRKAIIKAYDAQAHRATVQIAGSLGVWLDGVRVATDIIAADVVPGRQCTVLFHDQSNQDDAVVIAIQGALPSAITEDHRSLGAVYPGVLSTGVKAPQIPFKGDAFTATELYCRVTTAPQGQSIAVQIRRNGTSLGTVTIAASAKVGSTDINQAISDGDYFDINITQVGTSPNEGSDLVWIVAP